MVRLVVTVALKFIVEAKVVKGEAVVGYPEYVWMLPTASTHYFFQN